MRSLTGKGTPERSRERQKWGILGRAVWSRGRSLLRKACRVPAPQKCAPAGRGTRTFFYWFLSPRLRVSGGVHIACTPEPSAEPALLEIGGASGHVRLCGERLSTQGEVL